jgi:hypothetical protein
MAAIKKVKSQLGKTNKWAKIEVATELYPQQIELINNWNIDQLREACVLQMLMLKTLDKYIDPQLMRTIGLKLSKLGENK